MVSLEYPLPLSQGESLNRHIMSSIKTPFGDTLLLGNETKQAAMRIVFQVTDGASLLP